MSHAVLDNERYLERRLAQADATELRAARIVSQNLRRYIAIDEAVSRIRGIEGLNEQRILTRGMLAELLTEITTSLLAANRVRATDEDGPA